MFYIKKSIKESEIFLFLQSVCEFLKIKNDFVLSFESSLHCVGLKGREIFQKLIINLKKGKNLSVLLKEYNFPTYMIFFIQNGEKNNNLSQSFFSLKEFMEWKLEQSSKFVNAMIYPIFTICVFLMSFFIFAEYIIPTLAELTLKDSNFFIKIINILEYVFLGLTISFVILTFIFFLKFELFEKIMLKIPFVRNFVLYKYIYFISYFIYLAMEQGLSLVESIEIVIEAESGSTKNMLSKIKREIIKGDSIGNILKQYNILPKEAINIIKSGQDSGNLNNAFLLVSRLFMHKNKKQIEKVINILPIFLILFVGIFIISFICFLFLPIYNMEFAQ